MQQGINSPEPKNFRSGVPNTLVTLTLPYPLVTFRLEAFLFWHLTEGEGR